MAPDSTVGIDIGTTSVKAVLAGPDGRVVARSQVPHSLHVPSPMRFEHDPGEAWIDGVHAALERLGVADRGGAAGVNVSAMVPSLAPFDESGGPLGRGLLYGDERGAHHKTPTSDEGELLGFLEWMVDQHPEGTSFWPAQAAANHALGGVAAIDTTCAATTTPVWFGAGWNADVLDRLGVAADRLPVAADLGAAVGEVAALEGAVLGAGSIDAIGEQVVAGADERGDVLVILGTTLITWVVRDGWPEVDDLWTIPSMTTGAGLVGGPSNVGGLFTDWIRRLVGEGPGGGVDPLDPGRVPVFAPWPRGERVPLHDRSRRAGIMGLDLTHGPAAIRRAAFESTGFTVRDIVERATEGADPAQRIVVTGGGSRVAPWVQALADTTGLAVHPVAVPEGGALGSAWFARMAAGLEDDLGAAAGWASIGDPVEPDPSWAAACDERYHRHKALAEEG